MPSPALSHTRPRPARGWGMYRPPPAPKTKHPWRRCGSYCSPGGCSARGRGTRNTMRRPIINRNVVFILRPGHKSSMCGSPARLMLINRARGP